MAFNEKYLYYTVSIFLIFIATLQRSQDEELMDETTTLFLPILTFLCFLVVYLAILIIDPKYINIIILMMLSLFGYMSLVANFFYFYEFTEYEIQTEIFDESVDSSELTEILINYDEHKPEQKRKIRRNQTISTYFAKNIKYMKKLFIHMTILDFIIYLIAFSIIVSYLLTRNFIIAQLLLTSSCFQTIRTVKLDSVINGYTHLAILIFSDTISLIFSDPLENLFVEIKDPITLSMPQNYSRYSLLGLGDILVTALFIAVVKRFGEKKKCFGIYPFTLLGLVVSMIILLCVYDRNMVFFPGMYVVCPVLGLFPIIYATIKSKFKQFIKFKRTNRQYYIDS